MTEGNDEYTLIDTLENPNAECTDVAIDYYESLKKDVEKVFKNFAAKTKRNNTLFFWYWNRRSINSPRHCH